MCRLEILGASINRLEPVQACIVIALLLEILILYGKKPALFPLFFFLMEYLMNETQV